MKNLNLANGKLIPIIGYGEYLVDKDVCIESTINAIKLGYRSIDTAQSYLNEEEIGIAIKKCGVDRKELFITTKIWVDNIGYENTLNSINESLNKLQTDYLDLVLIHQPYGDYYDSWRCLEELYEKGVVRAIGVSNFSTERLADLLWNSKIKPMVNQVEINPLIQRKEHIKFCHDNNVIVQAWSPLGGHRINQIINNKELLKIAQIKNKSVAQIILRWLAQQDVVSLVKSNSIERMKENIDIFDFNLSNQEMQVIDSLDLNLPLIDHTKLDGFELIKEITEQRKKDKNFRLDDIKKW